MKQTFEDVNDKKKKNTTADISKIGNRRNEISTSLDESFSEQLSFKSAERVYEFIIDVI